MRASCLVVVVAIAVSCVEVEVEVEVKRSQFGVSSSDGEIVEVVSEDKIRSRGQDVQRTSSCGHLHSTHCTRRWHNLQWQWVPPN